MKETKRKQEQDIYKDSSSTVIADINSNDSAKNDSQKKVKSKKNKKRTRDLSDSRTDCRENQSADIPEPREPEKDNRQKSKKKKKIESEVSDEPEESLLLKIEKEQNHNSIVEHEKRKKAKKSKKASSNSKEEKRSKETVQVEVEETTKCPQESSPLSCRALEYLRMWKSNRSSWKFNKMLQIHLLHIMFEKSKVSDEDFDVLLQYLEGLVGKGREKTKENASKFLKMEDTDETEGDLDKEERARQIFQLLS